MCIYVYISLILSHLGKHGRATQGVSEAMKSSSRLRTIRLLTIRTVARISPVPVPRELIRFKRPVNSVERSTMIHLHNDSDPYP